MYQERCDRCGKKSNSYYIMSMYNEDVICASCKAKEERRADYEEAHNAEIAAVRSGNMNFKGIGLKSNPSLFKWSKADLTFDPKMQELFDMLSIACNGALTTPLGNYPSNSVTLSHDKLNQVIQCKVKTHDQDFTATLLFDPIKNEYYSYYNKQSSEKNLLCLTHVLKCWVFAGGTDGKQRKDHGVKTLANIIEYISKKYNRKNLNVRQFNCGYDRFDVYIFGIFDGIKSIETIAERTGLGYETVWDFCSINLVKDDYNARHDFEVGDSNFIVLEFFNRLSIGIERIVLEKEYSEWTFKRSAQGRPPKNMTDFAMEELKNIGVVKPSRSEIATAINSIEEVPVDPKLEID